LNEQDKPEVLDESENGFTKFLIEPSPVLKALKIALVPSN
jgi:hypothetical protein